MRVEARIISVILLSVFLAILPIAAFLILTTIVLPQEISGAFFSLLSDYFWIFFAAVLIGSAINYVFLSHLKERFILPLEKLSDELPLRFQDEKHVLKEEIKAEPGRTLASRIDTAAGQYHELRTKVDQKLKEASERVSRERDTLAAIIEQLDYGIIVTNSDGNILLFNAAAHTMLSNPEHDPPVYLGLGRSVEHIFDSAMVGLALRQSLKKDAEQPFHFISVSSDQKLRKGFVIAISPTGERKDGFIFVIKDVTATYKHKESKESGLIETVRKMRDATAGIRMTAENLVDYPHIETKQRSHFLGIIKDESQKLELLLESLQKSEEITETDREFSVMSSYGLAELVKAMKSEKDETAIKITYDTEENVTVKADSYTLPLGILSFISFLSSGNDESVAMHLSLFKKYLKISIEFEHKVPETNEIDEWMQQTPSYAKIQLPYPFSTVLKRHKAEWWTEETKKGHCISLILPKVEVHIPEKPKTPDNVSAFDFDLFRITPPKEILEIKLAHINAVVFDTETTGLYPSDGDRLVAVGGVRMVNGVLHESQVFNKLINPGKSISKDSTAIHGITNEMVADKPKSQKVLRDFHIFCGDDILIAHNAAFDMRFLELEQNFAGVTFSQPVIDTLLLSTILHPHLEGHSIDVLFERFNIKSEKRHDALGDALMTARIFVKMIPLLNQLGIVTVGDALKSSKESLYSKLKY